MIGSKINNEWNFQRDLAIGDPFRATGSLGRFTAVNRVQNTKADDPSFWLEIQSLDRLVSCWNHVVDIGCADVESSALKKAAGYVTLAEMAIEERSEYI